MIYQGVMDYEQSKLLFLMFIDGAEVSIYFQKFLVIHLLPLTRVGTQKLALKSSND